MDDPWFITYRGRAKLQITPANAKGWTALMAVTLASIVPTITAAVLMGDSPVLVAVTLLTLLPIWLLFIRWAMSKSEVINIDEILAERRARERDAKGRRGDRR